MFGKREVWQPGYEQFRNGGCQYPPFKPARPHFRFKSPDPTCQRLTLFATQGKFCGINALFMHCCIGFRSTFGEPFKGDVTGCRHRFQITADDLLPQQKLLHSGERNRQAVIAVGQPGDPLIPKADIRCSNDFLTLLLQEATFPVSSQTR